MLTLPILIPFATAILLKTLPFRPTLLRAVAFTSALGVLAAGIAILVRVRTAGIQVVEIAATPAPFGITLVADPFSAMLVVMVGIVAVAVTGHSFAGVDPRRESLGYHPLMQILLMGVAGAFMTGDVFNLYVWFEVMLIASFVLMTLNRTREQLQAAYVYVTINLIASSILLTGIGLLYGHAGTLNFADLASVWPDRATPLVDNALAVLFLTAFGVKAALFPLFFWLPASYHAPPPAIGALFAGLLTKVGVYAMIRLFTLVFRDPGATVYTILLVLSIATMLVGLAGAIAQRDVRRILSFNLVGHIGFTTVGLALWTPLALGASIFYLLHHILVITALFLVSALFLRQFRTDDIDRLGGLWRSNPAIAAIVLVPVFSLAGVPPLSGFLAKLAIVAAAIEAGSMVLVAVALLVGLLTLLSMARVWQQAVWKAAPAPAFMPLRRIDVAPIAWLVTLMLGLTVAAGPLFDASHYAAEMLLDPDAYVDAVLGDPSPGGN